MSTSVLERMFVNVLNLAEQYLRSEGRIVQLLYFSGPGGEAVMQVDAVEQEQALAKAQLMATALAAEACSWVTESLLVTPGLGARPIVVVLGEDHSAAGSAFAEIHRDGSELRLARFDTPLAAAGAADGTTSPLARFIRRTESANDVAKAWRELEAMGVNRGEGRRPLH